MKPARPSKGGVRGEARAIRRHSLAEPGTRFAAFIDAHRGDLERIVRATRGEHRLGDVVNEAWMLGEQMARKADDFDDPAFRDRLLRHLFQALVRYTEVHVRHAARLDQPAHADDDEGRANPLLRRLASDAGTGPLEGLLAEEDTREDCARSRIEQGSLADAWLILLDRYRTIHGVAACLLISVSHAYHCCARAREKVRWQRAMVVPAPGIVRVGAWRRFRTERIPFQFELDFRAQLPFAHDDVAVVSENGQVVKSGIE